MLLKFESMQKIPQEVHFSLALESSKNLKLLPVLEHDGMEDTKKGMRSANSMTTS